MLVLEFTKKEAREEILLISLQDVKDAVGSIAYDFSSIMNKIHHKLN